MLRKEFQSNAVGKNGTFSKLFVYMCNHEEEPVKLVAFGASADRLNAQFEENSVRIISVSCD